jgi:hypothetical protein
MAEFTFSETNAATAAKASRRNVPPDRALPATSRVRQVNRAGAGPAAEIVCIIDPKLEEIRNF